MSKVISLEERKRIQAEQQARWLNRGSYQPALPDEDEGSEEAKEASAYSCAINHLLCELAFPFELRSLIEALIELSQGKLDWFEIDDYSLACIARSEQSAFTNKPVKDKAYTKGSLQKWIQRSRKKLTDWADTKQANLFQCQPGGMKGKEKIRSKYKLPFLILIDETISTAKTDARFQTNPNAVIERVAKGVVWEHIGEMKQGTTKERFNRSKEGKGKHYKLSITYFDKFASQASIEEIEEYFNQICSRLELLRATKGKDQANAA